WRASRPGRARRPSPGSGASRDSRPGGLRGICIGWNLHEGAGGKRMSETRRIAEQLEAAFQGEAWPGPAVKEALVGVAAQQAAARPIAGAHTIWEITAHIAVWENAVRKRLQGQAAQPTAAEDWPPAGEGGEPAWAELKERLETGNRALRDAILAFDESRL